MAASFTTRLFTSNGTEAYDFSGLESYLLEALPTSAKDASTTLVLVVAVLVGFLLTLQRKQPNLSHIPILGPELGSSKARKDYFSKNSREFLRRGYTEFRDKAFQIETSEGPRVILGAEQTEEIRAKPDDVVDNRGPIEEAILTRFTKVPFADDVVLRSIKADLSTKLGTLTQALADATDKALAQEFPTAEDWTSVNAYSKILRIVAKVSTRIFIGEELTTNEDWLMLSIMYTINVTDGSRVLKLWRPWLRPFVYRFLPEIRNIRKSRSKAIDILTPIVRARREAMKKDGAEMPNDMLQWMMNERVKRGASPDDYIMQAEFQLALSFAAIHTTTMAVTNMLYDLGAMPEYQGIIRGELDEELSKVGGSWDGPLMKNLKKTDSFMKESQRREPIGFALMSRRVLKDIALKDGTHIPAGTTVSNNGYAIAHDPTILVTDSDLDTFDGMRYYKLGQSLTGANNGKHQFVSVNQASPMFGYGRHACPGRFFAGNEIKLILVKMLAHYDIKLEGDGGRYKNWQWEGGNNVDATKNIMIKRVGA